MRREDRRSLAAFTTLAVLFVYSSIALAQLPWVHPFIPGRAIAPCTLGVFTGQLTTWNSADKSGAVTLSGSDFTASYNGTGSTVAVRAIPVVPGRHTGKWYFVGHVDAGSTTGWVFGAANGSMPLTHYPGGQDANSVGCYAGNWTTQSVPPQNWTATLGTWVIIALDLDANKGWCGSANGSCVVNATGWSGPGPSLSGNPSTGTDGTNISAMNDGVSVMPAWGGNATSGTPQASLYTNTPMTGSTLSGFKYWDQP